MTTGMQLAGRLREVFLNGHWIANTNYKEALAPVDHEQSLQRFGSLNTIAMLTYHINYYLEGLIVAFTSGKLEISDKFSFDIPPVNTSETWQQLKNSLTANADIFSRLVEQMSETELHQVFINEKYGSYLRNIEGVIEHSYYHLGQVSLLKKLITENKP